MVEATSKATVVPKVGSRIKIVRHEPAQNNYSCLADWGEDFSVGSEHTVESVWGNEIHVVGWESPCLLKTEIEVIG